MSTNEHEVFIRGAKGLSIYFFNRADKKHVRKIYYWIKTSRIPVFRMGGMIYARPASIEEFIKKQEL